jgi:hypothetical protein
VQGLTVAVDSLHRSQEAAMTADQILGLFVIAGLILSFVLGAVW